MFRLSNFLTGFVASGLTLCEIDTVLNLPAGNFDPTGSPLAIAVSTLASLVSMITLEFFREWLKRWKQKRLMDDSKPIEDRLQSSTETGSPSSDKNDIILIENQTTRNP